MEPLSITASLLSVLEATAVVGKATISLYRNVRNAPRELAQASTRLLQTRVRLDVQLRLYQSLSSGDLNILLPDEALTAFQNDLENANKCLESVRDTLSARAGCTHSKQCFGWVTQDKRRIMMVLSNLRDIDDNLSALLTTLSL
ncbi:MAG: hypothetical protein Q9166_005749 [cf. Caloplaca sp. 2 TL-2023]